MAIAAEIQADLLATGAKALGIRLSETQTSRFVRYYDELARWNERVNLTSITEWEAVQSRHFLDSLSAALALSPQMLQSSSFIDVGSGGGFPGLPLKLAFPGMRGTLLEATAKKTAFLAHLSETLELEDISVRTGRAETLAHEAEMREAFDMALARAVAEVATLAELTLPFVRVGGIVVMHKKADIADELEQAQGAIETLGGRLREVLPVTLPGLDERALVVLEKQHPTPERYPRRSGMPAKRPLT
jgi:16S rRNA (guanine527-N7)-methyltransferase